MTAAVEVQGLPQREVLPVTTAEGKRGGQWLSRIGQAVGRGYDAIERRVLRNYLFLEFFGTRNSVEEVELIGKFQERVNTLFKQTESPNAKYGVRPSQTGQGEELFDLTTNERIAIRNAHYIVEGRPHTYYALEALGRPSSKGVRGTKAEMYLPEDHASFPFIVLTHKRLTGDDASEEFVIQPPTIKSPYKKYETTLRDEGRPVEKILAEPDPDASPSARQSPSDFAGLTFPTPPPPTEYIAPVIPFPTPEPPQTVPASATPAQEEKAA